MTLTWSFPTRILFFVLVLVFPHVTLGQNAFLTFPLPNRTPESAVINTVFDHSMPQQYHPNDVVVAYTGEEGRREFGASAFSVDFGFGALQGFKNCADSEFVTNNHYSGGGARQHIFYDGHPGYDYRTTDQDPSGRIDVLASAPGTVVCISLRTVDGADMNREENASACTEGPTQGEIKIDHGNGYSTIHLHLSSAGVHAGDTVIRGQKIGVSGETGAPGAPHLHFEVRQNISGVLVPIDPYGWEGFGPDPYTRATNVDLWLRESVSGSPTDIYFAVDLSGSFSDDLPLFKAQAPGIIATLKDSNPNIRFGLGKFEDYPISPFGSASAGDKAYVQLINLTLDSDVVLNAIAGLFTRFGGDGPQSQLPALFQAATGTGQDLSGAGFPEACIAPGQHAKFRDGATKLFLLWTDAPFHDPGDPGAIPYPGPSFEETVNAILALDPPRVIGISSGPFGIADLSRIAEATDSLAPSGGVDCDADGVIDIPEGEPLVCSIAPSGEGIGEAVIAIVEAATAEIEVTVDVKPSSDPNAINPVGSGLIPVAILTTENFDALTVSPITVRFGPSETGMAHRSAHLEDVDNDGDLDLVLHFRTQESGIQCGDTDASLTGETFDGQAIQGMDSIVTVSCR